MSFVQGTAEGYLDFLSQVVKHVTEVSAAVYTQAVGGNPNPTITQPTVDPGLPQETWTAVCQTGGGNGVALFDVTGSVSGLNATQATAGSAYDDNVQFTIDANGGTFVVGDQFEFSAGGWVLLDKRATGAVAAPVPGTGNVGNGAMSQPTTDTDSFPQRWVATCTTPGGAGVAVFSVVGSYSGAKANATSDVAYNDEVQFTITAGGIAWALGDEFVFWHDGEIYLRSDGVVTTEKPHVNIQTLHDVPGDRYNIRFQGATGFNVALGFEDQTGSIPVVQGIPVVLLWNTEINYTIVGRDSSIRAIAEAPGQPVESFVIGWFNPYGPPSKYPYPLFIGACHNNETKDASVQENAHGYWARDRFAAAEPANAHVRLPGGSWARLRNFVQASLADNANYCFVMPTAGMQQDHFIGPLENGDYPKHELLVAIHQTPVGVDEGTPEVGDKAPVGYLEGLYWTTGFNVITGTLLGDNPQHYVFQDTFRNGIADFAALALQP